jgi:hypothetical protein
LAEGVRAHVAAAQASIGEALAHLEGTRVPFDHPLVEASPVHSRAHEQFLRADLLRALGSDDEALAQYSTFFGDAHQGHLYRAAAHLAVGRLLAGRGRRVEAVQHFERVAELWAGCEPELRPLLHEARQQVEALGRGR